MHRFERDNVPVFRCINILEVSCLVSCDRGSESALVDLAYMDEKKDSRRRNGKQRHLNILVSMKEVCFLSSLVCSVDMYFFHSVNMTWTCAFWQI